MNKHLTDAELEKIHKLCFDNPSKSCAIAQEIIDYLQIMNCSTYSELKGISKRTVNYKVDKLIGVRIEDRKFICLNQ